MRSQQVHNEKRDTRSALENTLLALALAPCGDEVKTMKMAENGHGTEEKTGKMGGRVGIPFHSLCWVLPGFVLRGAHPLLLNQFPHNFTLAQGYE